MPQKSQPIILNVTFVAILVQGVSLVLTIIQAVLNLAKIN